ncbi:LPXTG cell wall anchor domain-containing protein [Micromonospora sp. C95]|uniref:LPXTG cell wall anchor domain-containing protein n=1 Tax=Micromonospora sp. C95 TaxID=2824882 RepID=UPI0027DD7DE1|nr:LPXTG cell wall anchor domain-containing protein [Micromonospora sp. C95]
MARAAVSGVAATALLALAAPAWASSTVPLHSAHQGSTAADFQQQCADSRFADRPADHDGWHFVLPGGPSAGGFESLTLTFDNGSDTVDVTVPDTADAYPDALYPAGQNGSRLIHAYLFTPAGWTLVDGSATISGQGDRFNLSHTCAGQPTPESPTPTPTTTPESPSPTPTVPESPTPTVPESPVPSDGTGGGGGDDDGSLPVTGAAVTTMALVGVGLIGGGVALVALRRRRDGITFTS